MKKLFVVLMLFCAFGSAFANKDKQQIEQDDSYHFAINLTEVKDDKLKVELIVPKIEKDEISYFLPKIIPGTYSIYDFGRFVSDFKAFDKEGKELKVNHKDHNEWIISEAKKLYKITYWSEDTYDTKQDNFVFEPAGTNIIEKENFILNANGFFGYFTDMKRNNYELTFIKPKGFYGATSLVATSSDETKDVYNVADYHLLVDSPMMFSEPDTTILNIGGAEIVIAVYSPNDILKSSDVAESLGKLLEAQKNYLGGSLPIKKYAFIIYLFSGNSGSGSMGALEHSHSSLYYLPEAPPRYLMPTIVDVSAHEFFHIVTPLSIHSEEIHYFDFNKPKMSRHLWMYEGCIEYFAHHVQINQDLSDIEVFLNTISDKMKSADKNFKTDLPFTELSLKCLGEEEDQYGNVYEKGALIGLALDLKLNQLSDGKYHLMNLMQDLSKIYGKEKPFKDEELFDKITELTYPEIREFFKKYVEGSEVLPLEELLATVGINYKAKMEKKEISFGGVDFGIDGDNQIVVASTKNIDEVGLAMGYETGDQIVSVNKMPINMKNAAEILQKLQNELKAGEKLTVVVKRENKKGKLKTKKLKTKIKEVVTNDEHAFELIEEISPAQRHLLRTWLKWED